MKYILKISLVLLVIVWVCSAQEKADHIDVLLKRNREVRAFEKMFQAAIERVKTVGVLPDPMVETSTFLSSIETKNGPMENQLMLGQKFPLWGKLKRKRQLSELKAEIAGFNFENKKIVVVYQMNMFWANYLKLYQSLHILNQYKSELESFRNVALTQYTTGVGMTQHPILKLQIEMSLIESQINTLQSNLETAVNELQSLFDGAFEPDMFGEEWEIKLPNKTSQDWLELARGYNPILQKAQRNLQIAVVQNELAVRKNYPDLITGITYTIIGEPENAMTGDSGKDAFGFKMGINLPIWFQRNRARIESSLIEIKAKEELVEETWNQIEDEVLSLKKQLEEIEETYNLYEGGLVQESEQMLSSAYSAYETGKISFLDLLDSERMVVKIRLEFEAVKAEKNIASAKMLKAIGLIRSIEE